MTISSHPYGNYIPVTLNEDEFDTGSLKMERIFLKFVISLKENPLPLVRLFDDFTPNKDMHFRQGNEGAEMWRVPIDDLKNLIVEINREIVRRANKQVLEREERHKKYERLEKEHKEKSIKG